MQYAESLFFMPENAFIVQKTVLSHPEDIKEPYMALTESG